MIVRTDSDWTTWNHVELQALQLSARQTLVDIAPYLERFYSRRNDLQAFQLDGLLFYSVEQVDGVLVDPALPPEFQDSARDGLK
jgi:hypothetical protein